MSLTVTIRTYTTDFYLFLHVLILESLRLMLYLSTGLWPHCSVDSCAARCCDSELRLTVIVAVTPIVLVTPIVRVTLLFSYSI